MAGISGVPLPIPSDRGRLSGKPAKMKRPVSLRRIYPEQVLRVSSLRHILSRTTPAPLTGLEPFHGGRATPARPGTESRLGDAQPQFRDHQDQVEASQRGRVP